MNQYRVADAARSDLDEIWFYISHRPMETESKLRGCCTGQEISHVCLNEQMTAAMESGRTKGYNQDDATGFIRLNLAKSPTVCHRFA